MSNRINPADIGMLNKINDKLGNTGSTGKVSSDPAHSTKEVRKQAAGSDTVELTSSAKLLERLEKTLAGLPEINSGRVDAVRTAIERGDYVIDSDKIAAALLRTDRELGD
ncbi:MAG: flagellar biosynthesis anti-sigma factor FlgM [Gammaproteobacteria bacterium]|nr:flagellar biosynthesis anti-sigma factor FlgM [Gammaproteobacteria bacterium]MDH4313236.1 flagellar biosynthesis anti-sigma factor FlgM [Gammaproteobacteria bacterium]MDH5213558.1 flagellar biosynthesis anti-sigma factor FlgM [Gammaproteobacteria bacterium]MDH5501916.1 flagellar biosynthesis anti-sigma factor FlgM [Gammaproteobacteria bacterium]